MFCSDSVTRVIIFVVSTLIVLKNDPGSIPITFFTKWLDSSHKLWLESEPFSQILETSDWKTQFVLTRRIELFVLQWWSILTQILFCLCLLVVLWYLKINCSTSHRGRTETLLFTGGPAGHKTRHRSLILYLYIANMELASYFTLSFFQRWRNLFVKSKFKPKLVFQNPMQMLKPNLVYIQIPITFIMQRSCVIQLKDSTNG